MAGKYKLHHAKVEDLILPGVTLRDIIEFNKFDLKEISEKTGVSVEDLKALQVGEKQFNEEISVALANFIKLPEDFWSNLQKLYNDEKAKILRREARMKKEKLVANPSLGNEAPKIPSEQTKVKTKVTEVDIDEILAKTSEKIAARAKSAKATVKNAESTKEEKETVKKATKSQSPKEKTDVKAENKPATKKAAPKKEKVEAEVKVKEDKKVAAKPKKEKVDAETKVKEDKKETTKKKAAKKDKEA
ncbi:MAG TPA: hypothetical protein GX709_03305 [Clostridiales bacterium]|nr:hypothetical protein [Clostridiales bacterium]